MAGNCYTEECQGIIKHVYGPHYFHTNNDRVWEWVTRFGEWETYVPRVKAWVDDQVFSLPINLMTMNQLWGVTTPKEAQEVLSSKLHDRKGSDAESHLLRTIGLELYAKFFYGYTFKQWDKLPRLLPSSIVSRLPVRFTYDDSYHTAKYQAVPTEGYTRIVEAMLEGIQVELDTDFHTMKTGDYQVIYTGPIDALYNYELGKLEYRSLIFEDEWLDQPDFQGCAQMNYPDIEVPFTRIIEHKHIHGSSSKRTLITREFPSAHGEPYYPIGTPKNQDLARKYRAKAESDGILVAGRLGLYKYLDMDGAIAAALNLADRILP